MHDSFLVDFAAAAQARAMRSLDDNYRVARHNFIDIAVKPQGGIWKAVASVKNTRTDSGASFIANLIGSAAGTPANYIALSSATLTPVKTDVALTGELTTAGLARAIAAFGAYTAPTALNGSASFQLSKTFTYTGSTTVNVVSGALLNAATAGTLLSEANFTPAQATVNANGDQVAVTWTITV